jgi:hypothetical protein
MAGLYRAAAPEVTVLESAAPALVFAEFCEAMGGATESRFIGLVRAISLAPGYSRRREQEYSTNKWRHNIAYFLQ